MEWFFFKKYTEVPFTGKTQGSFRNGKRHGSWVGYYEEGGLRKKGTYKNGKKDGS